MKNGITMLLLMHSEGSRASAQHGVAVKAGAKGTMHFCYVIVSI